MSRTPALFRDLIPYDDQKRPFVDRYAQFGVVFEQGRAVGPGTLQVRSTILHQPAADELLALHVRDGDRLYPVRRTDLTSMPWDVREEGMILADLTVQARHVFLDATRLLSEFCFVGGAETMSIHPVLTGQLSPERYGNEGQLRIFGVEEAPNRKTFVSMDAPQDDAGSSTAGPSISGGLMSDGEPFLPSPAVRVTRIDGVPATASISREPSWMTAGGLSGSGEGAVSSSQSVGGPTESGRIDDADGAALWYQFDLGAITLSPGESRTVRFVTELSVATYIRRTFQWTSADVPTTDEAIAASRDAFLGRVQFDSPPAVEVPGLIRGWRARFALTRTGYQGTGGAGEFAEHIASTCVPSDHAFTRAFFWDALFSSAAIARFEPTFAQGAILAEFVRQDERGYCPEHSFNYHVEGRNVVGAPQAPVASWAVDKYLVANPDDTAFLETVYPVLATNHRYWEAFSDRDRDGLAEWTWSGQTADNSPLWDEVKPKTLTGGCNWVPPIASVQLNSFLYRDAVHLADFADRLGRTDEAKRYRERAAALEEALVRICYLPEERRFWDYNHATRRYTRIRTFYMCWPIWAGMNVPEETKKDLIEGVLLDPEQFFGPVPFPSVAYDDPRYDAAGYWRGKAWPQITYWLLEMLAAEGYTAEAKEAARRFLSVYDREPSFPENITTNPSVYNAGGVADYNWGIAAYYLIATGAYLE